MPLPNHVQEKRDEIVEQVIQDIQAGKPFFWDCGIMASQRIISPRAICIMG